MHKICVRYAKEAVIFYMRVKYAGDICMLSTRHDQYIPRYVQDMPKTCANHEQHSAKKCAKYIQGAKKRTTCGSNARMTYNPQADARGIGVEIFCVP